MASPTWITETIENAQDGRGPCSGCPAFEDGRSACVNPGLFNHDAELMFITIEPSHTFDWSDYEDWKAYNERFTYLFLHEWTGGPILEELLNPIPGTSMDDVWMTDAIKCPPPDGVDNLRRDTEFDHCRTYLAEEIETVDPQAIVALGNHACNRTLDVVGSESASVKSSKECGRIIEGEYPVILSTHWGNSWLHRTPTKSWGDGWKGGQDHLRADSYENYMEIVQDAIRAVM